jgi:hypothetical protein
MFKILRIFLIALSLGIFILPNKILLAQQTEMCCEQQNKKDDCCNDKKDQSCHHDNSKNKSDNHCGNDCVSCHFCTIHLVFNHFSPKIHRQINDDMIAKKPNFGYEISFFSSDFQNIWQPPKIV